MFLEWSVTGLSKLAWSKIQDFVYLLITMNSFLSQDIDTLINQAEDYIW